MNSKAADKKGHVIVISGPSGVGKSTICKELCEKLPAEFSVSVTTRKPRPNEAPSRDYHYVSSDEFAKLRDGGELLEWAENYGKQCYGTPAKAVHAAIEEGRMIVLEIDINGCIQVRERIPAAIAFFILPPTAEEQKTRLEGRKTDAPESVAERLAKADGEIRYANESGCYDEFVVNDKLDETIAKIVLKIHDRQQD